MAIGAELLTGALAGIAFVGCNMTRARPAHAAQGQSRQGTPQAGRRREVVVSGKRVKTVDIHAHTIVPEAAAVINHPLEAPGLLWSNVGDRIAEMDAEGVDVEALSINPYWYRAERDAAAELIRIQNEKLAEFCAGTPDRFVAFATVALQHPSLAVEQLEHAVKNLGLRGLSVGGSVAGQELADPKFHPVWAKAEELGILIFMHPLGTRELEPTGRLRGSGLLTNTIGNPLETTIALSHLIFEGTLDRFPGLKICAAHGGGFLPSYANRSDAVITTFPDRVGPLPKKKPTQYLKDGQLYFDTIMFTGEAMRHLIAESGVGQVILGTDYPFPWNKVPVDHILSTPGLSDDDKIAILGGTAAKLLGIN
ncbi:MAG TPA: amidohydrolase family protein [Stellaceae bacterium]|jgi:aminocarboxymuconate-semialdehyde decarboxylase